MTRIHITGNAGSGKSTLAAQLGASLSIPVFGLDKIVWMPGWKKVSPNERQRLERSLVSRSSWVIEGVSKTVREAADVVILLDVGRPTAFLRCAKRNWRYLFHSRPGLPPNCPEILIIPRLSHLIWKFPRDIQPQIVSDMRDSRARSFHVRNAKDLELTLAQIGVK
jgi:adenylate kinase family enzyme